MKKIIKIFLSALILLNVIILFEARQAVSDEFAFVVAAGMRFSAMPQFRNSSSIQGACEAIKIAAPGSFMIRPGDIDPPGPVRKVIFMDLGDDFPCCPLVGNPELEADSHMVFLRNFNASGIKLPQQVNKGPPGCQETTYSFDWDEHHVVVLNQYYDGKTDTGSDGRMVPELLNWLIADLQCLSKKYTFVFCHEPLIARPDMDNGRIRHQGDTLNKYPRSCFEFHRILLEYDVTAYFCGNTHNIFTAKINGEWQVDAGHARSIEDIFPETQIYETPEKIKRRYRIFPAKCHAGQNHLYKSKNRQDGLRS